jgi:8-oxo-dGTP pyrophosphatase MutT (NUDIX family)
MRDTLINIFKEHDPVMKRALTPASDRLWVRPEVGDHSLYRPDPAVKDEFVSHALPLKASAVLVPIVERPIGYSILLTKRSEKLTNHSGQVSFPGGRCDDEDAHAMDTALREAHEEINLPHTNVEIIGAMEDYETVTGYNVTPVVGFVNPDFKIIPDADEVENVFEVS